MLVKLSRRRLLQSSTLAVGASLLGACSVTPKQHTPTKSRRIIHSQTQTPKRSDSENSLRIFASSGLAEDPSRIETGLNRLFQAGFVITNQQAAYRRFQRFAGTDAERIADLQDVATGRVHTPKVLLGMRGGYGAVRILPHIDWASLGDRMRERQTLLMGYSDVTAVQLALLAKGKMPSFAGPMLYSEFARSDLSFYSMENFIRATTQKHNTIRVFSPQSRQVHTEGILWGGNLSVLSSLVGSPYMPQIDGGILFVEDVSEQPYRIERMFYTLHLAGILKRQKAIILGDFSMGNIRDSYSASYNLNTVAQNIARITGIPVLTDFPFGHIANKITLPLGAHASVRSNASGGYDVSFSHYPTLNAEVFNLSALLPPPSFSITPTL